MHCNCNNPLGNISIEEMRRLAEEQKYDFYFIDERRWKRELFKRLDNILDLLQKQS